MNSLTKEIAGKIASMITDKGWDVEIKESEELNGTPRATLICKKNESNIAPTVHITDAMALDMLKGDYHKNIEELGNQMLASLEQAEETSQNMKVVVEGLTNIMQNRADFLSHVTMMLVNKKKNENADLVMVPTAGDLAYIFMIEVPGFEGCVKITHEHIARHGISEAELYTAALANTEKFRPAIVKTIGEMIHMPEFDHTGAKMYVVSTKSMVNGAVAITYPSVIQELTEILGEGFIIIPSSIHEVICCNAEALSSGMLVPIIADVNNSVLESKEYLSDHPYTIKDGVMIGA